jgi:CHASE2 domain-containing sensor protein
MVPFLDWRSTVFEFALWEWLFLGLVGIVAVLIAWQVINRRSD